MSISPARFFIATAFALPLLLGGCVVAPAPYYNQGYYNEGYAAPAPVVYAAPAVYAPAPFVVFRGGYGGWRGGRWR